MNQNSLYMKLNYFVYNNKTYNAGTEFIYNGKCEVNGQKIFLNNQHCKFLYSQDKSYFQVNDTICSCNTFDFTKNIVSIVESPKPQEKQSFYFTDEMFINTIWYIIIMIVGIVFHERVALWIFATIVYALSMRRNKN